MPGVAIRLERVRCASLRPTAVDGEVPRHDRRGNDEAHRRAIGRELDEDVRVVAGVGRAVARAAGPDVRVAAVNPEKGDAAAARAARDDVGVRVRGEVGVEAALGQLKQNEVFSCRPRVHGRGV